MTPSNRFARRLIVSASASLLLALWLMLISAPRAESALPLNPIQNAIDLASDGATIDIPDGLHTESITVTKNLTLTGVLSSTTIIQAVSGQRVITVTAWNNLRIENLTVTGGQAGGLEGGGIYVENGNLTVVNSRITNNSASYGGGIRAGDASKRVEVIGSILELNHASFDGGALYAAGNVSLTNSQVLSNTARHGGGVYISSGRGDLNGGIFQNNTATDTGGGISLNNSISVTGTQFISNTAGGAGGGLQQWNGGPSVSILSARFERNTSSDKGGGMRANGPTTISGTLFLSNTVHGTTNDVYGGGAHISNTLQVNTSTFTGNVASCTSCGYNYGGGLSIGGASNSAVVEDSLFERGSAFLGAGAYNEMYGVGGSVTVRRSTFRDNSGTYGAGIYTAHAQVENSDFLRNAVDRRGGGMDAQTAVVTATRFISNTAAGTPGDGGGGGIAVSYGVDGTNLLFAENEGGGNGSAASLYYFGAGSNAGNLRHVTIARTSMGASPAIVVPIGTLNIRNSIIVNHPVGIDLTGGMSDIDYTLFFGGGAPVQWAGVPGVWGTHNLEANPQFINSAAGDYHLMSSSPAKDYGTDLGVTTDLDGHSRPVGAKPDLGAYEYEPPVVPPVTPEPKTYLPLLKK